MPAPNSVMIKLEDVGENIYSNFLESIRSSETKRMYVRNLRKFLNLIPNNILEEYLGESPKSREIEDLATSFTNIARKDIAATKQIIKTYVKEIKKEINPTLLNFILSQVEDRNLTQHPEKRFKQSEAEEVFIFIKKLIVDVYKNLNDK